MKTSLECRGKHGQKCGRAMRQVKRKGKKFLAVLSKGIRQKGLALRTVCSFLASGTSSRRFECNLVMTQLLEIIWLFLYSQFAVRRAAQATKHSIVEIVIRWSMCRKVCTGVLNLQGKFVDTDNTLLLMNLVSQEEENAGGEDSRKWTGCG